MKRTRARAARRPQVSLESTRLYLGGSDSSGQMLEKLVAAIHGAAGADMQVTWNESIEGRQFDVVIRFTKCLHTYLTVIECKDLNRRVPVANVESFVTKSRDVNANKAVIVSAIGFQAGAARVAKKHGVKLLTIRERFHDDDSKEGALIPGINFHDVAFNPVDTSLQQIRLREEVGELAYVMDQPVIEYGGQKQKPSHLLWTAYPKAGIDLPASDELLTIDLPGATLTLDCEDPIAISGFSIRRRTINFRQTRPGKPVFDRPTRAYGASSRGDRRRGSRA